MTVGRLTLKKNNKSVSENFSFRNILSMTAIFVQTLHIFLILFRKRSITFHCNRVWQNADTFFNALGLETEEQIKLAKEQNSL